MSCNNSSSIYVNCYRLTGQVMLKNKIIKNVQPVLIKAAKIMEVNKI
ncbi:MAG: hypothetical protein A8274_1111 [Halanaerobium sp. 4-GBenrich]|jgi:hypothetical protein|nr:hypothetical protein [Halanaerobium congolense]KXS50113.1 MAG: hypothetical protein AWL62_398 [Halanaerobium sp. T82-1]ODS49924.1 MAG: hypothetical protein A8274_1111 [Halanaerobium sp. 4-GBenrich]PUU92650.1 MAG: hypothetical protein CI948_558 [Halanaerobium sp.]